MLEQAFMQGMEWGARVLGAVLVIVGGLAGVFGGAYVLSKGCIFLAVWITEFAKPLPPEPDLTQVRRPRTLRPGGAPDPLRPPSKTDLPNS